MTPNRAASRQASRLALPIAALLLAIAPWTQAGDRLVGTGGISDLEGVGGGGLTPWALITGYGTDAQIGGSAHLTHVEITDYRLDSAGVAVGIDDRLELTLDRLTLSLGSVSPGAEIREDVVGIKLKLAGDAVFEPDSIMPQVAVGLEFKHNLNEIPIPQAVGARRDADVDYYVSATKLWFGAVAGHNLLGNLTLRATRANQLGLLGFGGDRNDAYQLEPELSLGVFLRDDLATGLEYRHKPNNLSALHEDSFYDVFMVWFPVKSVSVTLASARLGQIATFQDQRGVLLSVQLDR